MIAGRQASRTRLGEPASPRCSHEPEAFGPIRKVVGLAANALGWLCVAALKGVIRLYQLTLSPLLGGQCRFHPTCSNYALEAIDRHGPLAGSWLALKRLLKCHPFHPGGVDLPPGSNG